jgi:RNA polymerase primary sigma factor
VQRTVAQDSLPTASEIKSTAADAAATAVAPSAAEARAEFALVRAAVTGDAAAANRFIASGSAPLWSAVMRLEGGNADGEAAFLHVVATLKADGFARLKAFEGRAQLSTFLALVARDILAKRLVVRFNVAPQDAWPHFTRFFDNDIRRRVREHFPRDAAAQDDAYQDVCLKLVEDNFRRIRAYGAHGSFVGYVLTIVDRLLIDLVRHEAPRRQLPTAFAKLPALEQAVYTAAAWEGCPADAQRLAAMLRGRLERDPDANEIAEALARVTALARPAARSRRLESVSLDAMVEDRAAIGLADTAPTPEFELLLAEEECHRTALVAAVKAAAELPVDERLYLQIVFSAAEPLPARNIARLLDRPVERGVTSQATRPALAQGSGDAAGFQPHHLNESASITMAEHLSHEITRLLAEPDGGSRRQGRVDALARARLSAGIAEGLDESQRAGAAGSGDRMRLAALLDHGLPPAERDAMLAALTQDPVGRAELVDAVNNTSHSVPPQLLARAVETSSRAPLRDRPATALWPSARAAMVFITPGAGPRGGLAGRGGDARRAVGDRRPVQPEQRPDRARPFRRRHRQEGAAGTKANRAGEVVRRQGCDGAAR